MITEYLRRHKSGVNELSRRKRVKAVQAAVVLIQRATRDWLERKHAVDAG